jgi:hypothetical protein
MAITSNIGEERGGLWLPLTDSRTIKFTTNLMRLHSKDKIKSLHLGSVSHPTFASYSLEFALPYTAGRTTLHPGATPSYDWVGCKRFGTPGILWLVAIINVRCESCYWNGEGEDVFVDRKFKISFISLIKATNAFPT